MNCHSNNTKDKHQHVGHIFHMILCCGLPIVVIALIPIVAKLSLPASRVLSGVAPFLCPLMMLMMIPMMFLGKKKQSCCDKNENNNIEADKM